jgi:hypothetical protein
LFNRADIREPASLRGCPLELSKQRWTELLTRNASLALRWMTSIARLSHTAIAHLLGARRQSVTRVVRELRDRGLIQTGYGVVELLDLDGLAAVMGPGPASVTPRRRRDGHPGCRRGRTSALRASSRGTKSHP